MSIGAWLFIGAVVGWFVGHFEARGEAKFWKGQADYWHKGSEQWMDRAFESEERPQLDVFALIVRLAPKTRFQEFSDALFEQGFCARFAMSERADGRIEADQTRLENSHVPDAATEEGDTNG